MQRASFMTCLIFDDNFAQPKTGAYTFTGNDGTTFYLLSSGNTGDINATGTTSGPFPE